MAQQGYHSAPMVNAQSTLAQTATIQQDIPALIQFFLPPSGQDWIRNDAWVDSDNGFDYGAVAKKTILPTTLHIRHKADYQLLAKKHGNSLDYDHINMLTAAECIDDHFLTVLHWAKKQES